jgi:ADP-heptose:LPS heptosyltransferase
VGFGDDIMATARVKALYARNPAPVLITGLDGKARWSEIWEHNPKIARTTESAGQRLRDGPGARPHLDYDLMTRERFFFKEVGLQPGEIFLTSIEKERARPVVVIEPHVKQGASPNKDWGFENYQELVSARPELPWVQCDYGAPILAGVEAIETMHFRDACAVLSGAIAAVLPEGGLHHAAAALQVSAVVIFGAYIPPTITGYDTHVNLARDMPDVVGLNRSDPRAKTALASITIDEVSNSLDRILARS